METEAKKVIIEPIPSEEWFPRWFNSKKSYLQFKSHHNETGCGEKSSRP